MKPFALLSLAVAIFSPQPQAPVAPIDVVLMVDVSGSVTQGVFKRDAGLVTDAAAALAANVVLGDAARVGTFGTEVRLTPAALNTAEAIHKAASSLTDAIGGSSPLWDALDVATTALSTGGARRGIIVLTDGRSSANKISFGDLLTTLEAARVAVFVIGLESGGSVQPDPAARLSYLADVTGGVFRRVKRKDVGAAVKEAVAALRAGATVTVR